jgi:hypothetical protein
MDALECISTKLDVRDFDAERKVSQEVKLNILSGARLTGSGNNSQHWNRLSPLYDKLLPARPKRMNSMSAKGEVQENIDTIYCLSTGLETVWNPTFDKSLMPYCDAVSRCRELLQLFCFCCWQFEFSITMSLS